MDTQTVSAWAKPLLVIGVAFAAFSTGAVVSLSVVTMRVVLANTTGISVLKAWKQAYDPAHKFNPPFGAVATLSYALLTFLNRNSSSSQFRLLVAATLCTFSFVPFTLLFLVPMNNELLRREEALQGMIIEKNTQQVSETDPGTVAMIQKWTRLNLVRSIFPAIGSMIAYYASSMA